MHFSSVFTREDTNSLPVPVTKFNGTEDERLGQLFVTPEVVASKINNMKDNKSPGVDRMSPKILKETVEQISSPHAHVFNMSRQEGIVPLEWKDANIIPLFNKGSRNKSGVWGRFCPLRPCRVSRVDRAPMRSRKTYM